MARRPLQEKKKSAEGSGKEDAIEVMAVVIEPLPNATTIADGLRTTVSYSEMMLTRSRNTALTASCHDHSDRGK